jgi:RNA polymerase sigma factor (sigma-70 family)
MAPLSADLLARHLQGLDAVERAAALDDGQLLGQYVRGNDADAFAALVRRHGPMVLRVCLGTLRDRQAAEDAFQATFLTLASRAASVRKPESVGCWLHGVARRLALKARAAARPPGPPPGPDRPAAGPPEEAAERELCAILDEELLGLPEAERAPLLLCYLGGLTQERAARQLGWSLSTLKRHLGRGRRRLRARLVRRGVTPSVALPAGALAPGAADAGVPPLLLAATTRAVPASPALLPAGTAKTLALARLSVAAVVLVLAGLAAGAGMLAGPARPDKPATLPRAWEAGRAGARPETPDRTDRDGERLPPGVVARIGTRHWRHEGGITGLAFSPDGARVITGGLDGRLRVWDAATGRQCLRIDTGAAHVTALVLSPGGTSVASAGMAAERTQPGRVDLWDLATGRRLLQIKREGWQPHDVAFSPDGKTLATASGEGSVSLLDAATGKERWRTHCPRPPVSVAFSPDGRTLASGDGETVRLWDPATGREVRRVDSRDYRDLNGLVFSPDDKAVAAVAQLSAPGAAGEKHVVLWDPVTGKKRQHFKIPIDGKPFVGGAVAFSPDGRTLAASGNDGGITLWDLAAGKERLRIRGASCQVWHLAFSPDSQTLAGTVMGQAVGLWDAATGRERRDAGEGHRCDITQLAFTPDARELATASDDASVRVWEVATGRQRLRLEHGSLVRALALSPDGKALASSSLDDSVRLWDVATGKQLHRWPGHGELGGRHLLAFSPDGRTLASFGDDWQLRVWEPATGREVLNRQPRLTGVPEFPPPGDQMGRDREREQRTMLYRAALAPDGCKLVVISPGRGHVVEVATGREFLTFPADPVPNALAVSPDGRLLALATREGPGVLVELATGKEVLRIRDVGEQSALAFSPDGRTLAAGGSTRRVGLWDIRTGRKLPALEPPAPPYALAFSPDGKLLAAGLGDTTALVWDLSAVLPKEEKPQQLSDKDLERLWERLGSDDAGRAHASRWALVAVPEKAVPLLRQRQRPDRGVDPDRLRRLVADLDSAEFAAREAASRELEQLGGEAEPALRRALERRPTPEARRRLSDLLALPPGRLRAGPEVLRGLRAVAALESIGTPGARQVLEDLAAGSPEARLTQEARAALGRRTRPR